MGEGTGGQRRRDGSTRVIMCQCNEKQSIIEKKKKKTLLHASGGAVPGSKEKFATYSDDNRPTTLDQPTTAARNGYSPPCVRTDADTDADDAAAGTRLAVRYASRYNSRTLATGGQRDAASCRTGC